MPTTERPQITDLLDSHRDLLRRHRPIMEELLAVGMKQGLDPNTMCWQPPRTAEI